MGRLDGAVAIVTGAGHGLGRAHALYLAKEGARVVVNDLGGDVHGIGRSLTPAQNVVEEIRAAGGEAIVNGADVSDWTQAEALIEQTLDEFGDLNVLVNNAGILRDRSLANMTEDEWDAVIRVHLKGHAAPTKHAIAYWRQRAKGRGDRPGYASVIHTSSVAGFAGNYGQANYASAKLAVCALSQVVMLEGERYGVRSNVVSPGARTRLSLTTPGSEERYRAPEDPTAFDPLSPANVSPLVAWLAAPNCPATGQMFHCDSNRVLVTSLPRVQELRQTDGQWTLAALDEALSDALQPGSNQTDWY
ncbi:MAG: SDR family NAD(P)-dependent oxidoreductase [Anaerolineaceae bacterium]|nr:SDR family NAD(P)-dependent oxidoreductase [Anaerolineaceae bacterium]